MDLVNINDSNEGEITNSVPYQDRAINSPNLNSSPTISNAISILESQQSQQSSSEQEQNFDDLVPFPPNVDPKVLANRLFQRQRKSKKMLNEFFIFRGEFVQELKRLNVRPRQTKVSALASTSWHNQQSHVKDEYRRLARETERIFMALKQREREADESCRTESSQSSPRDPTPPSTSPVPDLDNFQLPPPQTFQQMPTNPNFTPFLNNNNYYVKSPYLPSQNYILPGNLRSSPEVPYILDIYNNYNNAIIPSQSAQEADLYMNYHQ